MIGYAIVENDTIQIKTVSESEIGAIVNWLWGIGVRVTNNFPDDMIREMFDSYAKNQNARLSKVGVTQIL